MLKAFQSMKNDHYTAKDFNGFIKKFEYSLNYPECAPQNDNHQVTLAGNDAKDQNSLDECDY